MTVAEEALPKWHGTKASKPLPESAKTAASGPRRLLLVTHTAELGGAEFVLLDIARHYGRQCHVLLFSEGPLTRLLAEAGVGFSVLPAGARLTGVRQKSGVLRILLSVPSVAGLVLRAMRFARHYDIIYPNSQKAGVVMMLGAALMRRPLIWHLHDIVSGEHFAPLQRRLNTKLANLVKARDIVDCEAARAIYVQGGGNPTRVSVVYNGFDIARFTSWDEAKSALIRREIGAGDAPLVGLFSRISPWKGQHVLIKALAELPTVHAVIVGESLFNETDYKQTLITLASKLGVENRIHWMGHRDNIPELMRAMDIVVHGSTAAEPFGRVIAEGMMTARPVIATDRGAARELLGDEPVALVEPDDPAALAAAVRAILAMDPDERQRMGMRNRARAEVRFSLQAMLAGIERVVALHGIA